MTSPYPPTQARRPAFTLTLDRADLPRVLVAVGSGLVLAAAVVGSQYARRSGHLDGSTFTVGVLATLVLLGVAVAARLLAPASDATADLVSWPGAFGSVAAGLMLGVLITNDKASQYVASLAVIALSVGGWLLVRRAPFVLTTIAGLALLYARVFGDLFDPTGGGGSNAFMNLGLGVFAFVLVVTALGWLLPQTRVLSGVVVGVGGLIAMDLLLVAVIVARTFIGALGSAFGSTDGASGYGWFAYTPLDGQGGGQPYADYLPPVPKDPYKNDVYVLLLLCALLVVLWALAALATGAVGFRVLVAVAAVTVVPLATLAVMAEHPTWWEVVPTILGGAVLVLVGLQARRATGPGAPAAPAPGPVAPPPYEPPSAPPTLPG